MVAGSDPVVVNPSEKHTATLIFFHGLGDQGHGWSDVAKSELKLKYLKGIFPNAANRKVTLNFGMNMPAWYDLYGLSPDVQEDDAGIANATKYVHDLIDAEIKAGIPAKRIVLGGFSMGGALALYAGLTYKEPLGAIVGLSSFLLQRNKLPGDYKANLQTPIFLGHGTNDFLVPFTFGQLTAEAIKQFNPNVELHSYPMEHSSCPQELRDFKAFLEKHIPQQ
uniref:palmitoyl-protein hydrolase n=1 Tax=Acrobeloides nanus TaxID=290746 RepID=A0A914E1K2_9BILA